MAKTVTAAEMKERERAANEAGLLYIQMMENAGRAAWKELKARVPALRRLLIVAGKGNNGGDGFVMFKDDKLLKDSVMIDNAVLINYIVDELPHRRKLSLRQ